MSKYEKSNDLSVFPEGAEENPTPEKSEVIHINTSGVLAQRVERGLSSEVQRQQGALTPSMARTLAKRGLQSTLDAQTFRVDMWRAQQNLGSIQEFTMIAKQETDSNIKQAPEAEQQLLAEEQIFLEGIKNMFRDSLLVRRGDDDR